jgi:hypothetical protein
MNTLDEPPTEQKKVRHVLDGVVCVDWYRT